MTEREIPKELELEYMQCICEIYPQMTLDPPLTTENLEGYIPGMSSYEREFVSLLQSRGIVVFREPLIEGLNCRPDFFVYNPSTRTGKIVEVTLYDKGYSNGNGSYKSKNRKRRQEVSLQQMGIPYVILYRENLERIRRNCCPNLF